MFRKKRKPDPDERVELELRKVELNDRLTSIHDFLMLFFGGWILGLYFLVVERLAKYCMPTPLWSWSSACAIPTDEAIRQLLVMVGILVLGVFVVIICEDWRSKAIEEYREVLRRQNLLKSTAS
jgi:hypothetical protein